MTVLKRADGAESSVHTTLKNGLPRGALKHFCVSMADAECTVLKKARI